MRCEPQEVLPRETAVSGLRSAPPRYVIRQTPVRPPAVRSRRLNSDSDRRRAQLSFELNKMRNVRGGMYCPKGTSTSQVDSRAGFLGGAGSPFPLHLGRGTWNAVGLSTASVAPFGGQ